MKWIDKKNQYVNLADQLGELSPYQILGVERSATLSEIKAAYRRKIAVTHPDKSSTFMLSTDEELSKLINAAYQRLLQERRNER